jgi:hypothetical protein
MEKMSLKEFWDALEQRLKKCSGDDLRAVLRAMAQKTPPQRRAFLEKLKPVPPIVASAQKAVQQEEMRNCFSVAIS